MLRFFLDLLFPSFCVGCGTYLRGGKVLCTSCAARVPLHRTLLCGICRARVPGARSSCHHSPPFLLGAATDYEERAVRDLIAALKFRGVKAAARPLGDFLVRYGVAVPIPRTAVVLPIPLSPRRERERGFNQSLLLARIFSDAFALTLVTDALRRSRNTPPQSERGDAAARRANVAGCFIVEQPEAVRRATVILIDDVVTSGATFLEAARALKAAGAARIIALAVAKA